MTKVKITAFLVLAALAAIPVGQAKGELSNWKDKGTEIKSSVSIPVSGSLNFSGGTNCDTGVHFVLTWDPGSTGLVEEIYSTDSTDCEVVSTLKSLGCTVLHSITNPLGWRTQHNNGVYILVTNMKLTYHYTGGAFCPKIVTIEGDVTLTPDSTASIKNLTLSGTLKTSLGTNVTVSGTQAPVNASDSGTYGL